jgi:hypothetical protein
MILSAARRRQNSPISAHGVALSHAIDHKLALEAVSAGRVLDQKFNERESTKSSVDDLILGRGDVSF